MLDLIQSTKGKNLLVHENFLYEKNYEKSGTTYWGCMDYRTNKCRGRVSTSGEEVKTSCSAHNHLPDLEKVGARRIVSAIQEKAITNICQPTRRLIAETAISESTAINAALPSIPALKKVVQRARKAVNAPPATPTSFKDLIIPEIYTRTHQDEEFLLYDTGVDDPKRIIIFATQHNISLLAEPGCHWS